jgi:ubiquinone/menaquinone biosynthesis C-methylase UbiE
MIRFTPIAGGVCTVPLINAASFDTSADDVFGRIAGRHDVLCDLFSLGIHRYWKQRVAALIAAEPWTNMRLPTATC